MATSFSSSEESESDEDLSDSGCVLALAAETWSESCLSEEDSFDLASDSESLSESESESPSLEVSGANLRLPVPAG